MVRLKSFSRVFILCLLAVLLQVPAVGALLPEQKKLFQSGVYYFDSSTSSCTSSAAVSQSPDNTTKDQGAAQASGPNGGDTTVAASPASNTDYAGRNILIQGELKALSDNEPTYQKAAAQVGIPWQVLAAAHYREHDFSLVEPSNGQGVYQIVSSDKHTAGAYPASGVTLSDAQFLAQSLDAANFLKNDGAGLVTSSDLAAIKDALVKYNGEPQKYIDQAVALGYTSQEGYEGSPYVMNIADKPRDPSNGPLANWQQDQGGGNFHPATADQYGAFVVYASIGGLSLAGGGCTSSGADCKAAATADLSGTRQSVVCIALNELTKWQSGQLKPGSDFEVYSQGSPEDWCADFVSWVYDQANYPLKDGSGWRVPAVDTLKSIGLQNKNFHWHDKSGYVPKPGDIAVHNNGSINYHANIVVGMNGNQVALVGGNQGANDFTKSKVSKNFGSGDIIGYVAPD